MTSRPSSGVILVVEDQPANLLLARAALERAGFEVAGARNAVEARRYLEQTLPDLILMDIGLPGQDGLSFTRELKADPHTVDIPVVALTAHAMPEDRQRAASAGCDAYMSKPFRPRQLADLVTEVLHHAPRATPGSDVAPDS